MAKISYTTDVLVIGSGFAGNRASLGAAETGAKVIQATIGSGGSPNIMGFSAAVSEGDSADVIYSDIMKSGLGMNVPKLTRIYADATDELIPDMEAIGVPFKKDAAGKIQPLHSLGTTYPRLIIQYQCLTGNYIQKGLNAQIHAHPDITLRTNMMITDLIVDGGQVHGACGIDTVTGEFLIVKCRAVVVATGGSGRMHPFTTYPNDVTGDGMAMAYRAGLRIMDMELLQFEPCCFVHPASIYGYCNPTTFLKMGAKLLNNKGEAFITDYSTIQKDEMARKMHKEIVEGRGTPHGGIYYDVRMLPEEVVKVTHYVHYQPALEEGGIDICKEVSEVAPAGHSFQGGVVVNSDCSTDIAGLYIAGEAMGGVHGAKRMGGDAGGAALVFGKIAGKTVASAYGTLDFGKDSLILSLAEESERIARHARENKGESPHEFKKAIQDMMFTKVGLVKNEEGLACALADIGLFEEAFEKLGASSPHELRAVFSVRNMLYTARMMTLCAQKRTESRGVHYREDYPSQNDAAWLGKNVILSKEHDGKMKADVVVQETDG